MKKFNFFRCGRKRIRGVLRVLKHPPLLLLLLPPRKFFKSYSSTTYLRCNLATKLYVLPTFVIVKHRVFIRTSRYVELKR